jgi:hypothetical protein
MALSKDKTTLFMFTKVDLKDGYWRMAAGPNDPIQLVIPEALLKWYKVL